MLSVQTAPFVDNEVIEAAPAGFFCRHDSAWESVGSPNRLSMGSILEKACRQSRPLARAGQPAGCAQPDLTVGQPAETAVFSGQAQGGKDGNPEGQPADGQAVGTARTYSGMKVANRTLVNDRARPSSDGCGEAATADGRLVHVAVVKALPSHIPELLADIRLADVFECLAAGQPVDAAVVEALEISRQSWAGLIDGRVVCLFGVATAAWREDVGVPWLFGARGLARHSIRFLRRCRPYLHQMQSGYARLMNYVDADNETAIRWLSWLGFTLHDPEPYGPYGKLFRLFTMEVSSCVPLL